MHLQAQLLLPSCPNYSHQFEEQWGVVQEEMPRICPERCQEEIEATKVIFKCTITLLSN